jgi:bacteriorhodopsin
MSELTVDQYQLTVDQYKLVGTFFSFAIAAMGAATAFLWLNRSQVARYYRPALTISGLVTFIALYHYFRIYASWTSAYTVTDGVVVATGGVGFDDAYRYVDWLLTVPLLLIELILVMKLSKAVTFSKSVRLGFLAALMVALGYPGEVSDVASTRWLWWSLAMIPFLWIVYELFVSLKSSISNQPEEARGLVSSARWLVVLSWAFYPIVFIFPMIGLSGGAAETAVQIGYSIADVVSKAVFGVLIYMIAVRKSEAEGFMGDEVTSSKD